VGTRFFSMGNLSNAGRDEDDARTANTHMSQRKCATPHWIMKNFRTITQCTVLS